MDDQLKMNEEMRLKSYETLVQAQDTMSQTELGYRHMNTRFFAFEQGQMDKSQWADKKKEHEQQKGSRCDSDWILHYEKRMILLFRAKISFLEGKFTLYFKKIH